jgi:hypothetical protein
VGGPVTAGVAAAAAVGPGCVGGAATATVVILSKRGLEAWKALQP